MPLQSTDPLAAAFAVARSQLARVDETHFALPTPCEAWDVRALVKHMVEAPRFAANLVAGAQVIDAAPVFDGAGGLAARDLVAHHDETAKATLEAFGAPGALAKGVDLPFGERPAAFLMFFVASDQFVHAWDLARPVGGSTDFAPELAGELLEEGRTAVTPQMRSESGDTAYGPERTPPPGATPADRLAAFLGRTV